MPRIMETVHHGSFYQTRTVEVPSLAPDEVARVLAESPYGYAHLSGERLDAVVAGLSVLGRAEHGWSTFKVLGGGGES